MKAQSSKNRPALWVAFDSAHMIVVDVVKVTKCGMSG